LRQFNSSLYLSGIEELGSKPWSPPSPQRYILIWKKKTYAKKRDNAQRCHNLDLSHLRERFTAARKEGGKTAFNNHKKAAYIALSKRPQLSPIKL